MQLYNKEQAYRALMSAVIDRAIDDLKGIGLHCGKKEKDRAMAFILSDTCEAYCLELEIDIEAVREKAAALYRRVIEGEAPKTAGKNRPGRPPKEIRHICTRQSPGKFDSATYR